MIRLKLVFLFLKQRCHGNQFLLVLPIELIHPMQAVIVLARLMLGFAEKEDVVEQHECRLYSLYGCPRVMPAGRVSKKSTEPILMAIPHLHRESKKQDTKLLAITSLTIIRFSKFFH